MRTLIGIFTLALCSLLFVQTANAQSKAGTKIQGQVVDGPVPVKTVYKSIHLNTPEEAATLQTNRMAQKLGLSSAQTSELYQTNLQSAKKVEQLRNQRTTDVNSFQQDVRTNYEQRKVAVNSGLTTAQQKKYKSSTQKVTTFKKNATNR